MLRCQRPNTEGTQGPRTPPWPLPVPTTLPPVRAPLGEALEIALAAGGGEKFRGSRGLVGLLRLGQGQGLLFQVRRRCEISETAETKSPEQVVSTSSGRSPRPWSPGQSREQLGALGAGRGEGRKGGREGVAPGAGTRDAEPGLGVAFSGSSRNCCGQLWGAGQPLPPASPAQGTSAPNRTSELFTSHLAKRMKFLFSAHARPLCPIDLDVVPWK